MKGHDVPGQSRPAWHLFDILIAAFSLWLASARRLQFLAATFDDQLFGRLANSLRDGQWLGAYDKLTLAKGPGFPLFMALTSAIGIPLRLAEQTVYLFGCWLVCRVVRRLSGSHGMATLVFAVAALNPVLWGVSLDRVVRENFYLGLTVIVLGLAMQTLLTGERPLAMARRLSWGALLGLAFGWFWLTREEGLWLVPPLGLLALDWICRRWAARPASGRWRYAAMTLAVLAAPSATFAAVDLGVAAINRGFYGVFETNDFRSPQFEAAYGALSRIRHDHWQRLIPFPHDARLRSYAVSPAARELEPSLDGDNGGGWKAVGCSVLPIVPCNDIQSGWFMWAFRDAVERAQHYRTAKDATRYYARLAAELNAACDSGAIACLPARSGFLPPLRGNTSPSYCGTLGRWLGCSCISEVRRPTTPEVRTSPPPSLCFGALPSVPGSRRTSRDGSRSLTTSACRAGSMRPRARSA